MKSIISEQLQTSDEPAQEYDPEKEFAASIDKNELASQEVFDSSGEKQKKVQACAKEAEDDKVSQFSNTNSYQSEQEEQAEKL